MSGVEDGSAAATPGACLQRSFSVPTSTVIHDDTEAEVKIAIEGARLENVQGGVRVPLSGEWELKVVEVPAANVAPASLRRIGVPMPPPTILAVVSFEPESGGDEQQHLLAPGVIVLKELQTVCKFKYTFVFPGRFVEVRLPIEGLDDEDAETLVDSVEVLDLLLAQHATLRDKAKPHPRRAGVKLTGQGELLQKGFGDEVGSVIRRAAHFIAKRVGEYQSALTDMIEGCGSKVLGALPGCNAGTAVRLGQANIDDARRAAIIVENASNQGKSGVSFLLREVAAKVGVGMGEDVMESDVGQSLTRNRAAKEVRKVVLAAITAYEELSDAVAALPKPLITSIFAAVLKIVDHVWGRRACELARYSFNMLTGFMTTKLELMRCTPAALAMLTFRATAKTICDEPSDKVLHKLSQKEERGRRESADRQLLLQKLGRTRQVGAAPAAGPP